MNSVLIFEFTHFIHYIQSSYTYTDNPYLASIPGNLTIERIRNASTVYGEHVQQGLQHVMFDFFLWFQWTFFHWVLALFQLGFFIGLMAIVIYEVQDTPESLVFGLFIGRNLFLIFYGCYYRYLPEDYVVYYYIRRFFLRILVCFEIMQYLSVLSLLIYRFWVQYQWKPETFWAICVEGLVLASWYLIYHGITKKKEEINAYFR